MRKTKRPQADVPRVPPKEAVKLYLIMLPVLIYIFIFSYIPLYGVVIAFQDYTPGSPFLFDPSIKWVGLKHFTQFMSSMYFWRLIKNTLVLSLYNLIFVFWAPIIFALLVNEIRPRRYKKVVQTISYLPHFISSVVVAGMVLSFVNADGIINQLRGMIGLSAVAYNNDPNAFPWIYTLTNMWKGFGFGSILYLSAISAVDNELYEAANLDGATRWQKMWHITLPSIKPTIAIQLIFAVGGLLSANSEMILLLYNPAIYETSDVVGTYLYRESLLGGKFSSGTAIGLFTSAINFILVFAANTVSKKIADFSLW